MNTIFTYFGLSRISSVIPFMANVSQNAVMFLFNLVCVSVSFGVLLEGGVSSLCEEDATGDCRFLGVTCIREIKRINLI